MQISANCCFFQTSFSLVLYLLLLRISRNKLWLNLQQWLSYTLAPFARVPTQCQTLSVIRQWAYTCFGASLIRECNAKNALQMDTTFVAAEVWEKMLTVARHCSGQENSGGQGSDSEDAALSKMDWLAMHIHTITGKTLAIDSRVLRAEGIHQGHEVRCSGIRNPQGSLTCAQTSKHGHSCFTPPSGKQLPWPEIESASFGLSSTTPCACGGLDPRYYRCVSLSQQEELSGQMPLVCFNMTKLKSESYFVDVYIELLTVGAIHRELSVQQWLN